MPVTRTEIDAFLQERTVAVVGASRDRRKFGNTVYRELKQKGYRAIAVNPHADQIEGDVSYPSVKNLPEAVNAVVLVVPPQQSESVVRDAAAAGIARIWLQPGSESPQVITLARTLSLSVIHGHCILMFLEPTAWFHRLHRGINRLLRKLPQ